MIMAKDNASSDTIAYEVFMYHFLNYSSSSTLNESSSESTWNIFLSHFNIFRLVQNNGYIYGVWCDNLICTQVTMIKYGILNSYLLVLSNGCNKL